MTRERTRANCGDLSPNRLVQGKQWQFRLNKVKVSPDLWLLEIERDVRNNIAKY